MIGAPPASRCHARPSVLLATPMAAVHRRVLARRRDARNIAKVAAARELLECLYYALRDGHVVRLHDVRTGQVAESRSCRPPRSRV